MLAARADFVESAPMKRFIFFAALALAGCAHHAAATGSSASSFTITNGPGPMGFESPHAKGTISVASPMILRYESVQSNSESRVHWTIDRSELDFLGQVLEFGGRSYGELYGASAIEIRSDGVFVNGERRGDLPR